jgi:hypothetical protein
MKGMKIMKRRDNITHEVNNIFKSFMVFMPFMVKIKDIFQPPFKLKPLT